MSQSILWKNLALVEHKDEENFRILLDRAELTVEVANIPDKEGKTPMTYCLTKGELKSLPRCICKQIFSGVLFSCLHFDFSIADLDGLSNHYHILKRIKSLKNANLDRYANSCVLLKSQPTQNVNKKIRLLEKSDSKPHYGT